MKTSRITALIAVLFLFSAVAAFAAGSTKAAAAPSHGLKFRGAIVSVDEKAKTFAAKDSAGKTMDFSWNEATKAPKSPLSTGESVSVHYMEKGGKNVATVITANPPQSAAKVTTAKAVTAKAATTKATTKTTAKAKS